MTNLSQDWGFVSTGGDVDSAHDAKLAIVHTYGSNCRAIRFGEAHISYQGALALAQSIGDHAGIATIQFASARILSRLGNYMAGEAKALFQRSLDKAQENEDRFMEAYAQRALGELYRDEGYMAEAEGYLQQALRLFEQVEMKAEATTTAALLEGIAEPVMLAERIAVV